MDSKVALAEMVRESIVRALKKQNVVVPERTSDFEIDSTVIRCFHYVVDLFEGCYGERIEQQLFNRFELSPEMFDNPLVLTALARYRWASASVAWWNISPFYLTCAPAVRKLVSSSTMPT